ncbi:MAG TPA: hypothetical protein VGT07_13250 [Steroidobacteraceae bacterium]|nr:hypothetical protein [Steroidobacteraceae bacterium]
MPRRKTPDWAAFGRKGGKARLRATTKAQRQAIARLGVKASLQQTSPAQRKKMARKAAQVRWERYRKARTSR